MELTIIFTGIFIGGLLFSIKKIFPNFKVELLVKILATIYFALGFFRLFLPDDFLLVVNNSYNFTKNFSEVDLFTSILRWGYQTSLVLLPICAFFPRNKYIKRIIVFYCLPMLVLNILSWDTYMEYFLTGNVLKSNYQDPFGLGKLSDGFRMGHLFLELTFALLIEVYCLTDINIYKFKKKEFLKFVGLLIPVVIFTIPIYVPQSLFGYGTLKLTGFTAQNYIWILIMILVTFIVYFVFRFQSKENRYIVCLFFALSLFVLYNNFYIVGVSISRLPFQLCNLGCYLVLLAMMTKSQNLFDFIFIANVAGTIIAIMVPDATDWKGIFSFSDFHFMYEHMLLFILPILMVSLKIFKRPDLKGLKHALIGFTIYFMFCWVCGLYLNSISDTTGVTVNYFYIFKTDVVEYLTFLQFTRLFYFKWGAYTCYPIYQFLIYLGYFLLCVIVYYTANQIYKIADEHKSLRIIRIKEWEEKTGLTYPKNLDFTVEPIEMKTKGIYRCYIEKYNNYVNIKGRINTLEYWKTVLADFIHVAIYALLRAIGYLSFKRTGNLDTFNLIINTIFVIYILINLIPSVTALIRRLNDIDKNWKYILLIFIPVIGWIYLAGILILERKEGECNYVEN